MRRLKTFVIAASAITPDTDWVGGSGAPVAAEIFKLSPTAKGLELVALLTDGAGAPIAAAGTIDYEVVEQFTENVADPGTPQTRFSNVEQATAHPIGDQTQAAETGNLRGGREVAVRVSAYTAGPAAGILEIWAREA